MAFVLNTENGRTTKEEFNPELIEFRPPRVLDHGGKIIGLSYKGKPLRLQTPEMLLPYGVNIFQDPANPDVQKYSLDFSFRGEEENEKLAKFHEQMRKLEDVLIDRACENSVAWFKKKQDRAVVEAFFTPLLKVSKNKETGEPDGKYPDTLKVKLTLKGDDFECRVFDEYGAPMTEQLDSVVVKGTRATALIQASFIWFAGGKFGVSMKPLQMRVKVPERLGDKCVLVDDVSDEKAAEYSATMMAMGSSSKRGPAAFEDDEEDLGEGDAEGGDATVSSSVPVSAPVEDDEGDAEVDVPAPSSIVAAPTPARRRRAGAKA